MFANLDYRWGNVCTSWKLFVMAKFLRSQDFKTTFKKYPACIFLSVIANSKNPVCHDWPCTIVFLLFFLKNIMDFCSHGTHLLAFWGFFPLFLFIFKLSVKKHDRYMIMYLCMAIIECFALQYLVFYEMKRKGLNKL